MANALIESMSSAWQPEKYRDEYRDAVMEMIETKAKNKALPLHPLQRRGPRMWSILLKFYKRASTGRNLGG